jgi:hypothetical protein
MKGRRDRVYGGLKCRSDSLPLELRKVRQGAGVGDRQLGSQRFFDRLRPKVRGLAWFTVVLGQLAVSPQLAGTREAVGDQADRNRCLPR